MNDKNNKSLIEEAKISYEEIKKFAEEQASNNLQEQIDEKLKQIFQENIIINIDGAENIEIKKDEENKNIETDQIDKTVNTEEKDKEEMGLNPIENISDENDSDEFIVSDENDEISLEETIENNNVKEINKLKTEQEQLAPENMNQTQVTPINTDQTQVPVNNALANNNSSEENVSMPELLSKLDTLINIMMQQNNTSSTPATEEIKNNTVQNPTEKEQEFEVIDDEAANNPVQTNQNNTPPLQEEEIEITDFEDNENNEDKKFIDEIEEQIIEIIDNNENSVEESTGVSFSVKRTGDRNLKLNKMSDEKGHHSPVNTIKESVKAQNESKLDELIKENKSLKNSIKELQGERKEFEDAFVDLRSQFNEMQLFNGKLALVNKVLMNGGLTTEEKIKICEQFDKVETYEEANKLFKNIIKENKIKIDNNTSTKLKVNTTNTYKTQSTSEPLYESDETKRLKKLAGIGKTEE